MTDTTRALEFQKWLLMVLAELAPLTTDEKYQEARSIFHSIIPMLEGKSNIVTAYVVYLLLYDMFCRFEQLCESGALAE